jgi:hypothetical protein
MKTIATITLVLVLFVATSADDFSKVGTSGAQFLKIGVGAKYTAMGEASVAMVGDAYAMYWNPAALATLPKSSMEFTNISWLSGVDLNYFAFAKPTSFGAIGASVTALTSGDIEITTIDQPDGTGNFYSVTSYALGLGYAKQMTDFFSFGLTAKYISERISEETASGVAFDFGTLLRPGLQQLRLGINISNLGPEMKFSGPELNFNYNPEEGNGSYDDSKGVLDVDSYDLPLMFRIGAAYDVFPGEATRMTFSVEARDPSDNQQQASLGSEFAFNEMFFLRGGYKFNYDEENVALGGGVRLPVWDRSHLNVNYAWSDFGRLEDVHRFSFGLTF